MLYITSSIGGPKAEFEDIESVAKWFNNMPSVTWAVVWLKVKRRYVVVGRIVKDDLLRVVCDESICRLFKDKKNRGFI